MCNPLPLARLLPALGLCLALVTTGCGDSTETESTPLPAPDEAAPDPCDLTAGPIVLEGTLGRVTGGVAGIDETTLVSSTCSADPIPVTGATGDEIQVVETSTDCEDCADAMSGATSEPVEVRGELRPAGEVMAELAPGATLAAGDLVLVATTVTPIP